jgi:hypothetical protein
VIKVPPNKVAALPIANSAAVYAHLQTAERVFDAAVRLIIQVPNDAAALLTKIKQSKVTWQ